MIALAILVSVVLTYLSASGAAVFSDQKYDKATQRNGLIVFLVAASLSILCAYVAGYMSASS